MLRGPGVQLPRLPPPYLCALRGCPNLEHSTLLRWVLLICVIPMTKYIFEREKKKGLFSAWSGFKKIYFRLQRIRKFFINCFVKFCYFLLLFRRNVCEISQNFVISHCSFMNRNFKLQLPWFSIILDKKKTIETVLLHQVLSSDGLRHW